MKTVMITGETDGIGKHLAKKLASEGHSVIVHGRNSQKLEKDIKEIKDENAFPISILIKQIFQTVTMFTILQR